MKLNTRRMSAATLALVLSLYLAPSLSAAPNRDQDLDLRERIVRIIKKIQSHLLGGSSGVTILEDAPVPPRP